MGVCVPEEHGGAGSRLPDATSSSSRRSARADAGLGSTLAVHIGAGTMPILAHGTPEQVDRLVPPLAQGHELAAFALTESGSGSDAGAMLTRAAQDGERGRITGTKQWITNGSHAHTFIVFAKDPEQAERVRRAPRRRGLQPSPARRRSSA